MTVTEAGFTEGAQPGQLPFPRLGRNWLRSERPDLFEAVYPNLSLEPELESSDEQPNLGFSGNRNDVIIAYLEGHPEVDGVYSAGTWYQEAGNLGPFSDKWRGTTFWDRFTIMSNVPAYPADVWTLTEERNIEAVAFAERFHLTDPEGTDLTDEISPDLARRWAAGVYERGHNMLGPNMATGRFARTAVSYPAMSGEWIPRSPISTPTGVIAGTTNHVGYHPLITMHYEEGYLTAVEGGGLYGELARTHLCCYPSINTAEYPYYDGKPGFFYLHEIALGTNPKWFRPPSPDMSITTVNERLKAGYLHIGLGAELGARTGGSEEVRGVAGIHRRAEPALLPRAAPPPLFPDLYDRHQEQQPVGRHHPQRTYDEPRRSRGAGSRVSVRGPGRDPGRGLGRRDPGDQRAGQLRRVCA